MKTRELKAMAASKGVQDADKMDKIELIHAIQIAEGNSPCFQSDISAVCGIEDCLWQSEGCKEPK